MGSRIWRLGTIAAIIWLSQCTPTAPVSNDPDVLRALHEKVLDAHRESNVELLLEDEAAEYVVANRGAITRPSVDERRTQLGSYLGRTTFKEYRDVTEPIVRVSSDGSLGWVIVQVQASGIQTTPAGQKEPLEFVSAWIELYEKRDGRWVRVGNVSNFKPQAQ